MCWIFKIKDFTLILNGQLSGELTLSSCDGIGAWFHNNGLININTMNGGQQFIGPGSPINAAPQIENAAGNLIGASCVTVTGTFCAQGGEQWVVLGNFRNDASTQMSGSNPSNYMYIDEVSLFEICSTPLQTTIAASALSVCPGDCSQLTAAASGGSGSYSYLWMPGGATTSTLTVCPAVTTTYTLTTTSQSACGTQVTYTDSITITAGNCFTGVTATGSSVCSGVCASIQATAVGAASGISYSWQPGGLTGSSVNVCPLVTTAYTVTATDGSGLSFSDVCTVTVTQTPQANAGPDVQICSGTSATLTGAGGGSYSWNSAPISTTQSITVSPAATTDYILTVANGICTDQDTVRVQVVSAPTLVLQHTDISCYGLANGSATATISGGTQPLSFSWNPGNVNAGSISGLAAGTYTFSVSDAGGCTATQSVSIAQPAPLLLQINGASGMCKGEQVVLSAAVSGGTLGYSYNWHGAGPDQPSITVSPTTSTLYSVTVSDPRGCQNGSSHQLNVNSLPQALFSGSDTLCIPFNTGFTNHSSNAVNFEWTFGDGAVSSFTDPVHSYTTAGDYNVMLVASSANGCRDTFIVQHAVEAIAPPHNQITAMEYEVSELEPLVHFSFNSLYADQCVLDLGDGTLENACSGGVQHVYKDTGTYCASITSINTIGCTATSSVCIKVLPEFAFYIPDAFTPDNDGVNETFTGYGSNFSDFEMAIFDRWGEKIFFSDQYEKAWDGRRQGKEAVAQQDVYIYRIAVKDTNGNRHVYNGQVELIR